MARSCSFSQLAPPSCWAAPPGVVRAWCAARPPRTVDGVREDKLLRCLQTLQGDLRRLRPVYAVGQAQGERDVWRSRCTLLSARFDELGKAVLEHPSERLRGAPALRWSLYRTTQQLEGFDPQRLPQAAPINCERQ